MKIFINRPDNQIKGDEDNAPEGGIVAAIPVTSVIASEPIVFMENKKTEKPKETATSDNMESHDRRTYNFGFDQNTGSTKTASGEDSLVLRYLHEEDYKAGDLDTVAPGTYLHVIKVHPIYMGDGLFGFTYPEGGPNVYLRGDLRGEALRRVRNHEVAHHALRVGEEEARDLTGTQMGEFLPIYNKMKLRY